MPRVRVTPHLRRFFPDLADATPVEGTTVRAVIDAMEARHPGLRAYLCDERGALRQHVNVFVAGEMVRDRRTLGDTVAADDEIHLMQALSGGRE